MSKVYLMPVLTEDGKPAVLRLSHSAYVSMMQMARDQELWMRQMHWRKRKRMRNRFEAAQRRRNKLGLTPTGRWHVSQPNIQQNNPKTPEGAAIRAALSKEVFK